MRKVLIVQPSMQPPGGASGVSAWMLQALVHDVDVTVLTWWRMDVGPINRFYGTAIGPNEFRTLMVPRVTRMLVDNLPVPAALLRASLMMRHARAVSPGFDVVIGVYNEVDFGRRCIQYVHYPTYLRPRPDVDLRWYHRRFPFVLDTYYRASDALAGFSLDRMKRNLTLANSEWTGSHIRRFLGIDSRTLYPPVADPAPGLPWDERAHGFLAVGRISPEKEYERVMRILARVRLRVPGVTLTIVGTHDRHTQAYYESIRRLAGSMGSWISFREDLSSAELRTMMASSRYGIHGMREEHFGMAPAEMMRAGSIVWVPDGGGQVEIVGRQPELTFTDEEEAADKIAGVLSDPARQQHLRDMLAARAPMFSIQHFIDEVRTLVAGFRS